MNIFLFQNIHNTTRNFHDILSDIISGITDKDLPHSTSDKEDKVPEYSEEAIFETKKLVRFVSEKFGENNEDVISKIIYHLSLNKAVLFCKKEITEEHQKREKLNYKIFVTDKYDFSSDLYSNFENQGEAIAPTLKSSFDRTFSPKKEDIIFAIKLQNKIITKVEENIPTSDR